MSIAPPTEQRVLDAAQHLLQMHGYHGLSYAAVAAVVGLRKASVFHYFPTKDGLARAVVAGYRATVRGKMAAIDEATDNPAEKLVRYVDLYRELLERREHMCLCGLLAAAALTLPASVQTEMRGYFTEHEAWLGEVLAAGNAAAVLHLAGPVAVAAQLVLAGVEGALLVARAHDDDARFTTITTQLLAGVQARP